VFLWRFGLENRLSLKHLRAARTILGGLQVDVGDESERDHSPDVCG
jgi:hypothetical protein